MALKILIDQHPSVNLLVMNSLDGQGKDRNFFKNEFSHILPKPNKIELRIIELYFKAFVSSPRHLSLEHFSKIENNGTTIEAPLTPYQIIFVPTTEVQINSKTRKDFRNELKQLSEGAHLYRIEALENNESSERLHIGDLYLKSPFVASEYGDEKLFFQHRQ